MMLFLHFSDIHFKRTEVDEPDDPNRALRSDIINDVKRMRKEIGRPADGTWLTGDIAFAGHADEYDFAYRWLEEELCPAAGCKIEDVFVIPGNHDVDRKVETDPAQLMARDALRGKPANQIDRELRKWMRSKIASDVIFEEAKRHLRIRAGALHPDRDEEDWKPGYNWIDVSVDRIGAERELVVRVWVRQYEVDNFLTVPDPDGNPVWENRYDLPEWSPSEARKSEDEKAEGKSGEATVQVLESPTMQAAAPVSIRSVTIKFFKLKEHEQRRLISRMKLDKPGDRDMKDYELVIAAVKRSDEQGLLSELDRLIDQTLAGGTP